MCDSFGSSQNYFLFSYLLTQVARSGVVCWLPLWGTGNQNFSPKMTEFEDFICFSVVFAAFPVVLVVSGAAVQQSGRMQSKLLGQGHKPCVVLGRDSWFMCPGLGEVLGERRRRSRGEWSEHGENQDLFSLGVLWARGTQIRWIKGTFNAS